MGTLDDASTYTPPDELILMTDYRLHRQPLLYDVPTMFLHGTTIAYRAPPGEYSTTNINPGASVMSITNTLPYNYGMPGDRSPSVDNFDSRAELLLNPYDAMSKDSVLRHHARKKLIKLLHPPDFVYEVAIGKLKPDAFLYTSKKSAPGKTIDLVNHAMLKREMSESFFEGSQMLVLQDEPIHATKDGMRRKVAVRYRINGFDYECNFAFNFARVCSMLLDKTDKGGLKVRWIIVNAFRPPLPMDEFRHGLPVLQRFDDAFCSFTIVVSGHLRINAPGHDGNGGALPTLHAGETFVAYGPLWMQVADTQWNSAVTLTAVIGY